MSFSSTIIILAMQSLVARCANNNFRRAAVRGFASSAATRQAVPTEKPVLNKEFKIYRWVGCRFGLGAGSVRRSY